MNDYDALTVSITGYNQTLDNPMHIRTLSVSDFKFLSNKKVIFCGLPWEIFYVNEKLI